MDYTSVSCLPVCALGERIALAGDVAQSPPSIHISKRLLFSIVHEKSGVQQTKAITNSDFSSEFLYYFTCNADRVAMGKKMMRQHFRPLDCTVLSSSRLYTLLRQSASEASVLNVNTVKRQYQRQYR